MRGGRRRLAAWLVCCGVLGLLGPRCQARAVIANLDRDTGYVEFSQSGYGLMVGCTSAGARDYRWEFFGPEGAPLDVAFYDVGASTNAEGVLVDERFLGESRPHRCWQSVDLYAAGVLDFSIPGPPPHGYVRLTINAGAGDAASTTAPFRIGTTRPRTIRLLTNDGYMAWLEKPYQRWFRGDEVVQDLLVEREIDPSPLIWFAGFNKPRVWGASNGFFTKPLSDGRTLQDAVREAFAAVDAYNSTAPPALRIPRGWFGVAFDRIDLARKLDSDLCCVDDGSGSCGVGSITSPTDDFPACGGPYGSSGGPELWCGVGGEGGVGISTCHEADGSYGGLEGLPMADGSVGSPDSLSVDDLVYVEKSWVDVQDELYGVNRSPCELGDFRDFDKDWFCAAYGSKRCLLGPDAGDPCLDDSECFLGRCREAVPLFYGTLEQTWVGDPGDPYRCKNPYGYCQNDPSALCEGNSDCGGTRCVLGQTQGRCVRDVGTGVGIWDRRDPSVRTSQIGIILHMLEEAWGFRPGSSMDHFSVTIGGEGLLYNDRDSICRGDMKGCSQLDSNDNSFAARDRQFAHADVGDLRMHYRNPAKAGESEYFDSVLYRDFVKALREVYSDEAFLIYHGAKYSPVSPTGVSNRLWWMNETARQSLRSDDRGNVVQSQPATFAAGLNAAAPEARADSMGYAFRSDRVLQLAARHQSIDDGRPTVGVDHAQGALWSHWSIDPASDPETQCPTARFQGPGARGMGATATCSTQSPDCEVAPNGLCQEGSRDTCSIDPSASDWGSCRSLVLSVFDYDKRTWGTCSESPEKECLYDGDCSGSCVSNASIGAENVGIRVLLTDFDASALAAKGGRVDMDFGGLGCRDSGGVNAATYVGDPADADCDTPEGLLDRGGMAHVEVLDQAGQPFGEGETVILTGSFRKVGSGGPVAGAKLGFGHMSGEGWSSSASIDSRIRRVRSAATHRGPMLWFDGSGVYLGCPERFSGAIPVEDDQRVDFEIRWDRAEEMASLRIDGTSRKCAMPPAEGEVGGFVIVPVSDPETGDPLPFDIVWSDLSLAPAP